MGKIYNASMDQALSYAIISLAPPEINEKFRKAKSYFNSFYNNQRTTRPENYILKNMAHITLKRLFYLREGVHDTEVSEALTQISFQSIPITATELDIFVSPKHGNVLVVRVTKLPELMQLHTDIAELIDYFSHDQDPSFEKQDYNPHLSILYNLPEEQIEDAKQYALKNLVPINYTLQSFLFMQDVLGVVGEREMVQEYFPNG